LAKFSSLNCTQALAIGNQIQSEAFLLDRINRILQDYSFLYQIPDEFEKTQSAYGGNIIHSKGVRLDNKVRTYIPKKGTALRLMGDS